MLSSCPSSLARAWRASARARAGRPARSASSAASAAHQGEPGGTGLVARAASRRARLDNVPASPGSDESMRAPADAPAGPAATGPAAVPDTTLGASAPNKRISIAATCSPTATEPSVPAASTTIRHRRPSTRSKARSRPGTGIKGASPATPTGRPSKITWPVSRSKLGVSFITTTSHRIAAFASIFRWNLSSCPVRTDGGRLWLSYGRGVTVRRERRTTPGHVVVEKRARMAWSSATSHLAWSTPSGAAERSAHGRSMWCRLPM